jgi:hypothetical protein
MNRQNVSLVLLTGLFILGTVNGADIVPNEVQQPGTQPLEIGNLESPNKCDNCHGGYNSAVEPAHNWSGSMMAQAGRDPIFWATVAIAEQDFDGAGDLCLRCHSTGGWLAGRSTPTDGSGLAAGDSDGVECDYCHKLTNPDDSEHLGVMIDPFVANDDTEGYYGSGMSSMWGGSDKLGPYDNAAARHQFMQSEFHRDRDFCGTCHDVSNPVVGDLAHNHGAHQNQDPVIASGVPGSSVEGKAAFNNAPYRYGVVERTFSEYTSGAIRSTLVDDYPGLPEELRGGVLEAIYQASFNETTQTANYENPSAPRYYSCQSCHMRPVTGTGANKNGVPVRTDLPLHDMTGGNYWMAEAIEYLDGQGKLRLGGGMSNDQISAMQDAALRAREQLALAASLEVEGDEVKVINHTGHKLITGYPEGRRMWLNIKWFDENETLLREDGEYGDIEVSIDGVPTTVRSILDLTGAETRIYEAHMGMTEEWAAQLIDLEVDPGLALSYDRVSGAVTQTLGDLADPATADVATSFHFALNNTVEHDNRIPPYGMDYDEANRRNAAPVPEDQYEGTIHGVYEHYDELDLNPPVGAASASIDLLYQPTSWEYIQFLYLANDGSSSFLGNEGAYMLEAWLNTGMAEPAVMASAWWGAPGDSCEIDPPTLTSASAGDKEATLGWAPPAQGDAIAYRLYYDQAAKGQFIVEKDCQVGPCDSYTDTGLTNGQTYCYKVSAVSTDCESGFSNILCATPQPPGQIETVSATNLETGRWVRIGKGKNAELVFELTSDFNAGDEIVVRFIVEDDSHVPLGGATTNFTISGPESASLVSTVSGGDGSSEAAWQTARPNKKGQGGTQSGTYTATVTAINIPGYEWDGVASEVSFSVGVAGQSPEMHGGIHRKMPRPDG